MILKRFLPLVLLAACAVFAAEKSTTFKGPVGLQLYSLRDSLKGDVKGSLDKVKAWGITEVETYSLHGMTPEKLKAELESRGMKAISGHWQYEPLSKDLDKVAAEAKGLGCEYVACPWIPHAAAVFTEADARKAIADFNTWGEALSKKGLKFAYHPHGYEFQPFGDGTLFDLMMKETKPEFVHYEMDVFWITHPGQDPVKVLQKYPGRWVMMHLKDLKKGVRTGILTGHAPNEESVALGTGQVDWAGVLREAEKQGIKHFFIEDEAPAVESQVPQTLGFLKGLSL